MLPPRLPVQTDYMATFPASTRVAPPAQWAMCQRSPHTFYGGNVSTATPSRVSLSEDGAPHELLLSEEQVVVQPMPLRLPLQPTSLRLPVQPTCSAQLIYGYGVPAAAGPPADICYVDTSEWNMETMNLAGIEPEHWYLPCLKEQLFASPPLAQKALNEFGRQHGYAVVYKGTTHDKHRQRQLIRYGCDRHGSPRRPLAEESTQQRRNASSRKCGCKMEVHLVRKVNTGGVIMWELQHRERALEHNHAPSTHPASHPIQRRATRSDAVRLAIAIDSETGTTARQTIARLLVEDPSLIITPRDVYNERYRAGVVAVGSLSRMDCLLEKLRTGSYYMNYKQDINGRLTHLFFANEEAIDIYRENYDIVLLDCTYKTNRFNFPLLNIVGVTGMNTTIHIAQAFICGETEPDYHWALQQLRNLQDANGISPPQVFLTDRELALLNALETMFPNSPALLCIWHILKDVQAYARRHSFPKQVDPDTGRLCDSMLHESFCQAFLRVVNARTEEDFHFRLRELYLLAPVEATYVSDVWLDIWKYRIVRCWTDKVMHFGMYATSRVEGYHAAMKGWLGTSTGDFLTVHTRMEHWWRQSIDKHWVNVSNAEVYVPRRLRSNFFAAVIKVIHRNALHRCLETLQHGADLLRPCTGTYQRTLGLPCAHVLHPKMVGRVPLQPTDFHPYWWIRRNQAPRELPPRVLEPERIQDRRAQRAAERRAQRHMTGAGPRGTRRIPSAFEN